MLSTLLVIGGVLVGLLALLALIVGLSARPAPADRSTPRDRNGSWVGDAGRPQPDAWSEPRTTTGELPATR